MEEGLVLMSPSKYKRWRALLHRVITKQQSEREETHPACLHTVEKYKKVDSINTENDYKISKK